MSKLSIEDKNEIVRILKNSRSQLELAKQFGVCQQRISVVWNEYIKRNEVE